MSGAKSRAASRAAAIGSRAKQRSRKRTRWPAASRADATHARPLGTTGYGCRSRLVLTRSTRAPPPVPTSVLPFMTSTFRLPARSTTPVKLPARQRTSRRRSPHRCRSRRLRPHGAWARHSCAPDAQWTSRIPRTSGEPAEWRRAANLPEPPLSRPVLPRRRRLASWQASPQRR